jgi:hypothetical protein
MVERGLFPNGLPDVALLNDDAEALRVLFAMFAWALQDGLLRGREAPVELFLRYAVDQRPRLCGNAINCLAQCTRDESAEWTRELCTIENVLPICRRAFGEMMTRGSDDALELLAVLVVNSPPQVLCDIAQEEFIDALFDLMLLDDGPARIWSIGVVAALLRAGKAINDHSFAHRIHKFPAFSDCLDKTDDCDEFWSEFLEALSVGPRHPESILNK